MLKLLIIDDCTQYATWFKNHFANEFQVEHLFARDILNGQSPNLVQKFDVLLIDLFMPEIDGFSLWRQLSDRYKRLPKSFLISESNQPKHRELALRLKFDDYLHKEMSDTEILLRIKNRSKDAVGTGSEIDRELIHLGHMEFSLTQMSCRLLNEVISLTKTEFLILRELATIKDHRLPRNKLMHQVWPDKSVVKQTLNTHIFNLNDKLRVWEYGLRIDKDEIVSIYPK